ncbi:MAG: type II toxin-antitoxin system RelE/ParE family toxin [Calditrichaeota bacterium]|nr:type II toxin-antitoxin system RelE/ParE family toxin [Calditrichota bacterium]
MSQSSQQLKKLRHNSVLVTRLYAAFQDIAASPNSGKFLDGIHDGDRSWRVGEWRIFYRVYSDQLIILILNVANRKEVYR